MSQIRLTAENDNLYAEQVTIAAGTAESEPVSTRGMALVGIEMPAAWTAARIGFKAGIDKLQTVTDNLGALVQSVAAASIFIPVPLDATVFAPHMSITSVDAAGVAVNQAAERQLTLLFRRYLS